MRECSNGRLFFFSFSFRFKCRHSHAFFRHSTTFCMLLFWYYKDFNFKNVLLYIYVFCIKSWVRGCWNFSVDFSNHLKGHASTVEGSKEYSKFDSILHFISCFKHPKIRVFREKKNENTCNNQLKVLEIWLYKHSIIFKRFATTFEQFGKIQQFWILCHSLCFHWWWPLCVICWLFGWFVCLFIFVVQCSSAKWIQLSEHVLVEVEQLWILFKILFSCSISTLNSCVQCIQNSL